MEARLSKVKLLFDVLILYVNTVGIVGALTEALRIPCARADWKIFWGVLFLFCQVSMLFWSSRKVRLYHILLCVLSYGLLAAVFWKKLLAGLLLGTAGAVESLNERYQFRVTLPSAAVLLREAGWGPGWEQGAENWLITVSMLCVLLPFVMLSACLFSRGRCLWLWAGNALWLVAACTFDRFPDYFYLGFCLVGLAAVLVRKDFAGSHRAGMWAGVWVAALSSGVLAFAYHFVLPLADEAYMKAAEHRMKFFRLVNEEWIPEVQDFLADLGLGNHGVSQGADVTGELHRQNLLSYTGEEVYRVTVNTFPQDVVYLKCFVGVTYGEEEWSPASDRDLERYYSENDLVLPDDYSELVNINYDAIGRLGGGVSTRRVQVEEMGPRGSYSVYPYGARLTEDYKVHADGSVERRDREYDFYYRPPWGLKAGGYSGSVSGVSSLVEEQYRQYVHDSFLDYPKELELFWQYLEEENIRDESIYRCARDIMLFLDSLAEYDLEAESNPPEEDFVEYFLFQSHRGYCVHFATAGVLALRYCGVPARYVTGYMLSPWDFKRQQDGTYTAAVTGKQAHAWAEVYVDGAGWMPVEMTPGSMASSTDRREEQMRQLLETEARWEQALATLQPPTLPAQSDAVAEVTPVPDRFQSGAGQNVPEPSREPAADNSGSGGGMGESSSGDNSPGEGTSSGGERFQIPGAAVVTGTALAALTVLFFLAGRLRKRAVRRWHRALQAAGHRERVLLLYRNLRRVLRVAGCPQRLEAGEAGFWQKIQDIFPECPVGGYEEFCGILEKATFGREEPSSEEVQSVSLFHDSMVRNVYKNTPVYKRPLLGLFQCRREGLCVQGGEEKCL